MFKSEIRTSTINELLEKVKNQNYGHYLKSMTIQRARSVIDQKINFDFPVTAIIGPNGGGKSTILGGAALYASVKPSYFMAKSGMYDESMKNWAFEYEIIDKKTKPRDLIKRKVSFTKSKWSRKAMTRNVCIFGVSRTVPASERKELRKCVSANFTSTTPPVMISSTVISGVKKILDKDISRFNSLNINSRGEVTLLTGITCNDEKYSEFHFGAGESSIIRMLVKLDEIVDNTLVLIEEIENGLHPVACIRLVEHLILLAKEKNLQVIFTSHSNDALKPLPPEAIWASVGGKLFQGKLDVTSLRAVTGEVDNKLTIFVEDSFSATWIKTLLRTRSSIALDALEIHAMNGDGIAVNVHRYHNINPSIKQKSICIIDGDSKQPDDSENFIFRLPGQSPERFIFDKVIEKIDTLIGELSVMLLQQYSDSQSIKEKIQSISNLNRDPHLLFSQIGEKLGFISENTVKEAFITIWTHSYPQEATEFVEKFEKMLPKETDQISL